LTGLLLLLAGLLLSAAALLSTGLAALARLLVLLAALLSALIWICHLESHSCWISPRTQHAAREKCSVARAIWKARRGCDATPLRRSKPRARRIGARVERDKPRPSLRPYAGSICLCGLDLTPRRALLRAPAVVANEGAKLRSMLGLTGDDAAAVQVA